MVTTTTYPETVDSRDQKEHDERCSQDVHDYDDGYDYDQEVLGQ